MITFDYLLSHRIGFGTFQIKSLLTVCMIDFLDGSEMLLANFLPAILQKEYNLSDTLVAFTAGCFFFGVFLGNLIAGIFSDIIGRKKTMLYGNLIELACYILFYFSQQLWFIIVLRILVGISLGITLPLSYLIVSEIVPQNIRGQILIVLQAFLTIGHFYFILLSYFFMDTLTEGNWRLICIWHVLPCILMILENIFFLEETARFYITNQEYEKGFQILDEMGKQNLNNNNFKILNFEKQKIQSWRDHTFSVVFQYSSWNRFLGLFNQENIGYTIRLTIIIGILNFISGGIAFLIPFMFERFSIVLPLMAESYSTMYRAMGLSIGASLGRLSAAIGPFIIYPLFQIHEQLPFFLFTIGGFLGVICVYTYPLETVQQELDQTQKIQKYIHQQEINKIQQNNQFQTNQINEYQPLQSQNY